jgi:hypothetical protein
MLQLPNSCRCSKLSVHPQNWKSSTAKTTTKWYISFRFHDPRFRNDNPTGKLIRLKGMNVTKNLSERQGITQMTIDKMLKLLTEDGYNPITQVHTKEIDPTDSTELTPKTPFIKALLFSKDHIRCVKETLLDIKSVRLRQHQYI